MSKKSPKKSDENKSWRKPRRDRAIPIAPACHLIVTEGTKTEPLYFSGLKKRIDEKYKDKVVIEKIEGLGGGANTLSILDAAIKLYNSSGGKYDHIWIVYDKDDFPKDDFDNTYFKCKEHSCDAVTYHALWSNECIELWFLLHFIRLDANLHRDEYYPKLTQHLNRNYEKNMADIYDLLNPHLKIAIRNAKALIKKQQDIVPSRCTPGTAVYEIFEELKAYL